MSEGREDLGPPPVRMSGSLLFFLILAGVALAVLMVLALYDPPYQPPSGAEDPLVGRRLSSMRLEPLTGDPSPVDLDALEGRVTLVNFWGTWCGPCHVEFPHLYALHKELVSDNDDFRLLPVSCEQDEEEPDLDKLRERTEIFLERMKADLPTWHDPEGVTRVAFMKLQRSADFGYPTTILFDREGKIAGVWRGYYDGMEEDVALVTKAVLDPPKNFGQKNVVTEK